MKRTRQNRDEPAQSAKMMLPIVQTGKWKMCCILAVFFVMTPHFSSAQYYDQYYNSYYHQTNDKYYEQQQQQSCAPPASANNYDWEQYNFYEILGLSEDHHKNINNNNNNNNNNKSKIQASSSNLFKGRKKRQKERNAVRPADVRKAYRKQAQLYHPDKLAAKQKNKRNNNNNNETDTSTSGVDDNGFDGTCETTMSLEESNARFARIAEAYEVLGDEEKRKEYDEYLLDCEDALQQQQDYRESSNRYNPSNQDYRKSSEDARAVFDEFFFGRQEQQQQQQRNRQHSYSSSSSSSSSSSWEDDMYSGGRRNQYYRSAPVNVYEESEFMYDPYTGREVIRIFRTEEYVPQQDQKFYYRVVGQDFMEQFDTYSGVVSLRPITDPFLVEEGYRLVSQQHDYYSQQQTHQKHVNRQQLSTLLPGEVLTPEAPVLTSPNGRYYAGLSLECELLIFMKGGSLSSGPNPDEDTIVWSSETYAPPSYRSTFGECNLAMHGLYLVLALGDVEHKGTHLWYSEESRFVEDDQDSYYFARLDNDGSLTVYQQHITHYGRTQPPPKSKKRGPLGWLGKVFKGDGKNGERTKAGSKSNTPHTRAAGAWDAVRRWAGQIVNRRGEKKSNQNESSSSSSDREDDDGPPPFSEVCIFSTGPAGCNSPARQIRLITSTVGRSLTGAVSKVDEALDKFIETLAAGEAEDEDVIDALFRVVGNTGVGLGRAGQRIAQRGFHSGRMITKVLRDTIKQHLDRMHV